MIYNVALGEQEKKILNEFTRGKYYQSRTNPTRKYNDSLLNNLNIGITRLSICIQQISFIIDVFQYIEQEYEVTMFSDINTLFNIIKSVSKERNLGKIYKHAVEDYPVNTKELQRALDRSAKRMIERMRYLVNDVMPAYTHKIGLDPYIEWLEANDDSFFNNTREALQQYKKENGDYRINDEDMKQEYFRQFAIQYYEKIKSIALANNFSVDPPIEEIKQNHEKYLENKKIKQKEDAIAKQQAMTDRYSLYASRIIAQYQGAIDKGVGFKGFETTSVTLYLNAVMNNKYYNYPNKIYYILEVTSDTGFKFYSGEKDGHCKSLLNSTGFSEEDYKQGIVNEIANKLKELYPQRYIEVFSIDFSRRGSVKDTLQHIEHTEKTQEEWKKHKYYTKKAKAELFEFINSYIKDIVLDSLYSKKSSYPNIIPDKYIQALVSTLRRKDKRIKGYENLLVKYSVGSANLEKIIKLYLELKNTNLDDFAAQSLKYLHIVGIQGSYNERITAKDRTYEEAIYEWAAKNKLNYEKKNTDYKDPYYGCAVVTFTPSIVLEMSASSVANFNNAIQYSNIPNLSNLKMAVIYCIDPMNNVVYVSKVHPSYGMFSTSSDIKDAKRYNSNKRLEADLQIILADIVNNPNRQGIQVQIKYIGN